MAKFIIDLEPEPSESGFSKLMKFVFWMVIIGIVLRMCAH